MTEAAIGGGAPAPAEAPVAALSDDQGLHNNALGSQTPVKDAPASPDPAKAPSASEAVKQAIEQVKAKAEVTEAAKVAPEKPAEAKPAAEKVRAEDGKFAPKTVAPEAAAAPERAEPVQPEGAKPSEGRAPHHEPPARFVPEARGEWEKVPELVKQETHRAIQNLEQGHQKYKAAAEQHEAIRPHAEWLEKNGTNLKDGLDKYIALDHLISTNPIQALKEICQIKGFTLDHVVQHLTGQTPDQRASEQNQELVSLRQTVARLEQQVGGVTQTFQKQQSDATLSQVQEFAAKNPRFDELADDIGFFIQSGRTKDLSEAYSLAERLNPAPAAPQPLIAARLPEPAQRQPGSKPFNAAGTKSIGGAPSSGTTGNGKPRILSNSDAVTAALQRIG